MPEIEHVHDNRCIHMDDNGVPVDTPICRDSSPEGGRWVCTLEDGHDGPHVACNDNNCFISVWDDDGNGTGFDSGLTAHYPNNEEKRIEIALERLPAAATTDTQESGETTYRVYHSTCGGYTRITTDNTTQKKTVCDTCGRSFTADLNHAETASRKLSYK